MTVDRDYIHCHEKFKFIVIGNRHVKAVCACSHEIARFENTQI
jgi:hypothetical protein